VVQKDRAQFRGGKHSQCQRYTMPHGASGILSEIDKSPKIQENKLTAIINDNIPLTLVTVDWQMLANQKHIL
jgi:hypothetical protein